MTSLPVVTIGPSDIAFMRQWARDHGPASASMTVRQLSTMHRPGTLPMTAYEQGMPVNLLPEETSEQELEGEEVQQEPEPEDDEPTFRI